jgi:hypothetical protein
MGRKIGSSRYKEKSTIADDLRKILRPGRIAPADPLISGCDTPCRSAESQTTDRTIGGTADEIAYLRTAQRALAQVMECFHKGVPDLGGLSVTELNGYDLDSAKVLKTTTQDFDSLKNPCGTGLSSGDEQVICYRSGQLNGSNGMKPRQSLAAAHISQLPVGGSPIQPLTYATGQATTRNSRLILQQALNSADHLGLEFLSTCDHASLLTPFSHGVQKKDVGNAQGFAGGLLAIISR